MEEIILQQNIARGRKDNIHSLFVMKIGIDASRANNIQKTGVEWYAFFLIQELKKIVPGDVEVVLYSEKALEGDIAVLPKNWSSKVLNWPPRRFWTQIRMSYEMLFHAPDILFIPAHVFPLIHPKKTVMTVHDVAAFRFSKSYNRFEQWYSLWSAKYAVKKLWKVIVPSEFTKKELQELSECENKNVVTVYHGFDAQIQEKKNPEEVQTILKKYKVQKPFFLTIGRLEEKKNTARVIRAFDIFKSRGVQSQNFQFVCIGKPGYGYEKVQNAINVSPNKKDILELGYVEQADMTVLLQEAFALVFPSLYEGFGIPVLEGFAARIPVVTSSTTSTKEIAGDAALLVDPEFVEDIADAFQLVSEKTSLIQTLIEKGTSRVQNFSWKKCAEKTLDVFLKN